MKYSHRVSLLLGVFNQELVNTFAAAQGVYAPLFCIAVPQLRLCRKGFFWQYSWSGAAGIELRQPCKCVDDTKRFGFVCLLVCLFVGLFVCFVFGWEGGGGGVHSYFLF